MRKEGNPREKIQQIVPFLLNHWPTMGQSQGIPQSPPEGPSQASGGGGAMANQTQKRKTMAELRSRTEPRTRAFSVSKCPIAQTLRHAICARLSKCNTTGASREAKVWNQMRHWTFEQLDTGGEKPSQHSFYQLNLRKSSRFGTKTELKKRGQNQNLWNPEKAATQIIGQQLQVLMRRGLQKMHQ